MLRTSALSVSEPHPGGDKIGKLYGGEEYEHLCFGSMAVIAAGHGLLLSNISSSEHQHSSRHRLSLPASSVSLALSYREVHRAGESRARSIDGYPLFPTAYYFVYLSPDLIEFKSDSTMRD